jgi:integrase
MSDARRTRSRYPNIWYRETKDGRAYEISFRDATGRRRWQRVPGFDDVEVARAALSEAQGKARKGEKIAPAGLRFGTVAERYLNSRQFSRLGGWTQKNYRAALDREILPRFAHVKIAAVDRAMIAAFIGELERREKRNGTKGRPRKSTIEGILKPMRGVLRHAVKEGLLSASPFSMLDRDDRPAADEEPHEAHEWTDDEIEALLAASRARARGKDARYDYTPFLTVAVKAGLRLGEGLGLDWPDLELTKGAGAVNVRRQWTRLRELTPPKAGSRRRVPISDVSS